ncbi:MAG: hypothetical protein AB2401_02695 [Bacillus sp. (in: firmicutes)]
MHTTNSLNLSQFTFSVNNHEASFEDIFPDFNETDRIGIVLRSPGGSAGASSLLMAAITKFYDFHRPLLGAEKDKLWIYPDYFVFHINHWHMDHYWLDVWPPHKEVIVENDPEQILEAINDRGITRLIVEDMSPNQATFLRETVTNAKLRIKSALAYAANGRVENDVRIRNRSQAETYVRDSLKRTKGISSEFYQEICNARDGLVVDDWVEETFRRIKVDDALNMLSDSTEPGPTTKHYISLL